MNKGLVSVCFYLGGRGGAWWIFGGVHSLLGHTAFKVRAYDHGQCCEGGEDEKYEVPEHFLALVESGAVSLL